MRYVLIFFLLSSGFLHAQTYTTQTTTTEKARKAFDEGYAFGEKKQDAIALGYFEKAIKADSIFIDAYMAMGETHTGLNDHFKAIGAFQNALKLDTVYAPVAFFRMAMLQMFLDQNDEAVKNFESYLRSKSTNVENRAVATRLLKHARFRSWAVKNPVPFNPVSLGEGVNTTAGEYFPSLTADGETLIFTRRENDNEDFYRSTLKDSIWQKAEPLEGVNTPLNEGAQAISPDGSIVLFTACFREGDGSQGSCDIYWSQEKSTGWTTPSPFSASINSKSWDSQPTISADGKTIIFCSRRPGGRGAEDLWITNRQADGKWGKAENLGPAINSGGQEQTPYLHPDGQTLYFCSDSLPGMGGTDLFVARRQPDGSWGTPENLGYPINTKGNEIALTISLDGKTAYYATNGKETKSLDLYSFELPIHARPQPVTFVRARTTDAVTGKMISARMEVIDLATGQVYATANTRKDGTALVCLPAGRNYALNVNRKDYLFHSENFNLGLDHNIDKPYKINIALQPLTMSEGSGNIGKAVVLRNVFFSTGSAELLPESGTELKRLAELLKDNPSVKVQVNGHTDNVGDDAANLKLSDNRARAVYDFLISQGVETARLRSKGFGENKPIESNDTAEGRAKNRRTEFELW